jgi:transcriptional regulator with XRE-family HTH domain
MDDGERKGRFGRQVRLQRMARGMTLEDLAQRVGLPVDYIDAVENGIQDPALAIVVALAKGLSVRPAELFNMTLN